jgi:hypothetical protein
VTLISVSPWLALWFAEVKVADPPLGFSVTVFWFTLQEYAPPVGLTVVEQDPVTVAEGAVEPRDKCWRSHVIVTSGTTVVGAAWIVMSSGINWKIKSYS